VTGAKSWNGATSIAKTTVSPRMSLKHVFPKEGKNRGKSGFTGEPARTPKKSEARQKKPTQLQALWKVTS